MRRNKLNDIVTIGLALLMVILLVSLPWLSRGQGASEEIDWTIYYEGKAVKVTEVECHGCIQYWDEGIQRYVILGHGWVATGEKVNAR